MALGLNPTNRPLSIIHSATKLNASGSIDYRRSHKYRLAASRASSLSGQSDMRLKWIAAARVIEVARQLSHRIKSERFNEFLEHPATCR
jgi:hypothetical protein